MKGKALKKIETNKVVYKNCVVTNRLVIVFEP
jgi:hypothetical protein